MTVTPDDSARLQHAGIVLLTNLGSVLTVTLLHGVFIMVFSIAVHTTLGRGLKSRSTLAVFILIILSFTGANIYWAAAMAGYTIQIRSVFVNNVGMELSQKFALANAETESLLLIENILNPCLWIINDIMVVWRAWGLFPERRWVMAGPLFFLLAASVTMLTSLVIYAMSPTGSVSIATTYCAIIISIVTNTLATLLIAYKLWDHRKFISNLGLRQRQSYVEKVLFLLIESGVVFLGLQLASLVLSWLAPDITDTVANYAAQIFFMIYIETAAMYSSLILIIVNKERSIVNTFGFSTIHRHNFNGEGHANGAEHRPATIGQFVAANLSTMGTVDNEQSLSHRHSAFPGGPGSIVSQVA